MPSISYRLAPEVSSQQHPWSLCGISVCDGAVMKLPGLGFHWSSSPAEYHGMPSYSLTEFAHHSFTSILV
jgi:hypothetical protein